MFKHKHSQAGFGIVEVLCFIVMFSMVGLIGWYVINENQTAQETLDNIDSAEVQTKDIKNSAKAGEKFVFKELKVEIVVSDKLRGLTYSKSDDDSGFYDVTTPYFKDADKDCGGVFGQIIQNDGQFPETRSEGNNLELLKQFDSSYVAANFFPCSSAPGAPADTPKIIEALKEAFKTATLVE